MNKQLIENRFFYEDNKDIFSIFSTKKPRDIVNGTYHGIKNISIGVSLGFVSFITLPIYLTINEGVPGLVKGISVGIITGIGLPIMGIGYGGIQFVKGIYNTPTAISSYYNGKYWDKDERKWILYNLTIEYNEIKNNLYSNKYINNHVIDKKLYDILQVDTNCSQKEIKKAYHKLALIHHPDKNKKNNNNIFNSINEAYNILIDVEKRSKYDIDGYEKYKNNNFNIKDFYIYIFETNNINDFIGELTLIDYLNKVPINSLFKKKKRETILAKNLCSFLQKFIVIGQNSLNFYNEYYNSLSNILCKFIFNIIGIIYIESAENYLYYFKSFINSISLKFRYIQNNIYFLKSYINLLYEKNKLNNSAIDIFFNIIISDIETTIKNVCNKILYDNSVSNNERINRANGLIFIGNIFTGGKINYEEVQVFLKKKLKIFS